MRGAGLALLLLLGVLLLPPVSRRAEAEGLAPDLMLGHVGATRARYDDTLLDIARRFDLGFVELRAANPQVDVWLPGAGRDIVLPLARFLPDAPRQGIVINLPEMRLYWFPGKGRAIESFPIGIGREGRQTPLGGTAVMRKTKAPSWYPPAWRRAESPELPAVVPPGPDNPLGDFAMYLGWDAYLIHGTNIPWAVGRRLSAGCIRMYPEDVEHLFAEVPVGTRVTVVDQQVKTGWIDGQLYVQIYPSQQQADEIEADGRFHPETPPDLDTRIRQAAGPAIDRIDWEVVQQAVMDRSGMPVQITR